QRAAGDREQHAQECGHLKSSLKDRSSVRSLTSWDWRTNSIPRIPRESPVDSWASETRRQLKQRCVPGREDRELIERQVAREDVAQLKLSCAAIAAQPLHPQAEAEIAVAHQHIVVAVLDRPSTAAEHSAQIAPRLLGFADREPPCDARPWENQIH